MIKTFIRWLRGRCIKCGRNKIEWRGADACPIHDLIPGFREEDYPI
jgi:NADPH-dependent glutamate synthase beta subunit-like oxidoreductase